MAADAPAFVYDCLEVEKGASWEEADLPRLGGRQWHKLGDKQVSRIEERDHMVIYRSAMGTSLPYNFVEETADHAKLRYERRGQHDLIVVRNIKANIVSCLCNDQQLIHTCVHAITCIY